MNINNVHRMDKGRGGHGKAIARSLIMGIKADKVDLGHRTHNHGHLFQTKIQLLPLLLQVQQFTTQTHSRCILLQGNKFPFTKLQERGKSHNDIIAPQFKKLERLIP
jgi:hypothetical protein